MWILAEDVRDGQRIAFPQFSTALTNDTARYSQLLAEHLDDVLKAIREGYEEQLRIIDTAGLPDYERSAKLADLETRMSATVAQKRREVSRCRTAESLALFGGATYPVRSVRHTSSWDDVTAYTQRQERTSTHRDDLPSFDD